MKPITDYSKLPKFLVISNAQVQKSSNKYLLKPYRKGEIVRVAPSEEQKPNHEFDQMTTRVEHCTDEFWKEHYVKILRKGDDGKFSLPYVISWDGVEVMKKFNKI